MRSRMLHSCLWFRSPAQDHHTPPPPPPPHPTPGKDFDELQHKGKEVTKLKEQLRCSWLTLRAWRLCWTRKLSVPHVKGSCVLNPRQSEPIDLGSSLICSAWPTSCYPTEDITITSLSQEGNVKKKTDTKSTGLELHARKKIYLAQNTGRRKKVVQLISQTSEVLPRRYRFRKSNKQPWWNCG